MSRLSLSIVAVVASLAVYGCQEKSAVCSSLTTEPKLGLGTLTNRAEGWAISYIDRNGWRDDPITLDHSVALTQPLDVLDGHKVLFEGTLVDRPIHCGLVMGKEPQLKIYRLAVVK